MTPVECPQPIELHVDQQEEPVRVLCGCGRCPRPDPTPRQLQRRIEDDLLAWEWRP